MISSICMAMMSCVRRIKLDAQYYRINLEDYACPGFVSFSKAYYGTLVQFQAFVEALASDERCCKDYGHLIEMFHEYTSEEKLLDSEPLLSPVELIKTETSKIDKLSWQHMNIWDCPYMMACDHVETVHVWLKDEDGYFRCLLARFDSLTCNGKALSNRFWGFPHVIAQEDNITFNRLAVMEKRLTRWMSAIKITQPLGQHK